MEDQGEYECHAKNDRTHISDKITLSIQSKPVFTIPIGDQFVDENDEVIWTCEAFGIPDVEYMWLRNGEPMITDKEKMAPEDRDRYVIKDNVLKIRQVQKDRDEGMYQCKATNDLDSRFSSGQLRVLKLKPSFTKFPLEPTVYGAMGGSVTIQCRPEAAPRPNITWYLNGNRIGEGGKRKIFPSGTIQITQLTSADSGQYDCVASNKYGTDRSIGLLQVKQGPRFTGPQSTKPNPRVIVSTGEDVELRCQADSDDILDRAYYWRLNDFILQFYDDYETERQLELKNAGASRVQSEIYHFNHLNNADDILSNALYESDNIRYIGDQASHWPQLLILASHWSILRYKGTGDLKKFRRGVRDGHLIIQNITIAEAGSYQCMVETAVGTIFATSNVIVHSQPGPPGGVTAVKVILASHWSIF